jgi:hypothetical protein
LKDIVLIAILGIKLFMDGPVAQTFFKSISILYYSGGVVTIIYLTFVKEPAKVNTSYFGENVSKPPKNKRTYKDPR